MRSAHSVSSKISELHACSFRKSKTKMASSAKGQTGTEKVSRKRKRPDIPGFTHSGASTPTVSSQAPRGINAAEFAEARALEINNMVEAIKEADRSSGKRLFQTLPRHMRRRAMSHNVKRMPVRLRHRASLEVCRIMERGSYKYNKARVYHVAGNISLLLPVPPPPPPSFLP